MLIQRFAAVALGIMMGTSLLLQTGTVLAAKSEAYYTTQKISDYKKGEFAVVVGPSGAGKTTVLNILGGMDTATSGEVWIDGKNIVKYFTL